MPLPHRRLFFLVLMVFLALPSCLAKSEAGVRPPGVAGSFYPLEAEPLRTSVDAALGRVPASSRPANVVALIAPHAGYPFSGDVAAWSFAAVQGRRFKRVVLVAPSHFEAFSYSSVYDGEAYSTPLGRVAVDREFARRLARADSTIRLGGAGHGIGNPSEHAIEVELPFLQRALGDFTLVPVVMGNPSYDASRRLGVALAKLLRDSPDTLLVASSDLSHYHDYQAAVRMDHGLLDAITQGDFLTASRNATSGIWEACGIGPIVAVMIAAERLGPVHPRLLKYANSGDVTGDKARVVGYAAVVFVRAPAPAGDPEEFALGPDERAELLRIARASAEKMVRERQVYDPPVPASPRLTQERAAFVTLTSHGDLRGCIGYVAPLHPLYLAVRDVAALAAVRDPRFSPVKKGDLAGLEYEISVLSLFHPVRGAQEVRVGKHGLLVRQAGKEGVLLPQVAVEQRWDSETFLQQASIKAGLAPEAWKQSDTDVFAFTSLVFSDHPAKPQP